MNSEKNAFFAAANTAKGFVSFFAECFDNPKIDRLFLLKGGPGTGKSRFLREVAREGEAHGWQTLYLCCSSDPTSLDGVILRKSGQGIGLVDTTSPHDYTPLCPGVREETVDLGVFWDASVLRKRKAEIAFRDVEKKNAYRQAYRFLSSYENLRLVRDDLIRPCVRFDAIDKTVEKMTRELPAGSGFSTETALLRAFSVQGRVMLEPSLFRARTLYAVEDCHGVAQYLQSRLVNAGMKKEQPLRLSRNPISLDVVDGILFSEGNLGCLTVGFRESVPDATRVSARKFLKLSAVRAEKAKITDTERLMRCMAGEAERHMDAVKHAHFALESIYGSAMDFPAKEAFTAAFCRQLFGNATDQ